MRLIEMNCDWCNRSAMDKKTGWVPFLSGYARNSTPICMECLKEKLLNGELEDTVGKNPTILWENQNELGGASPKKAVPSPWWSYWKQKQDERLGN